jgi:LPXTG-site transpeptidase (sortase) family protein
MRRFARLVAVLLLLAFPAAAGAQQYLSDTVQTRYADAFAYLVQHDAVDGFADGSGRPGRPITRVEALKAVLSLQASYRDRVAWFTAHLPPLPLYPDLNQYAWYAPYVETAFEEGLITGYPDHTFRPNAPLKAEEGIVLLERAYRQPVAQGAGSDWFAPAAQDAFAKNIVSAHEKIRAGDVLTRGQFFDMLYRFDVVTTKQLTAFAEPVWQPPVVVPAAAVPVPVKPKVVAPKPIAKVPVVQTPVAPVPAVTIPAPVVSQIPTAQAQTAPEAPTVSQKPFAISIPALGIDDLTVTHPTDPTTSEGLLSVLQSGVGHLFSYPGTNGKIMIYGHSSGYPWDVSKYTKIFRTVNKLNVGDRVYLTFRGKLYTYEVSYKEAVPANDMKPFTGQGEELILYTCWPPDSIKQRYLVHATPVSSVAKR